MRPQTSNRITPGSRLRRQEDVLKQEAEGTAVLLSLETGQYYVLNQVGGRVWDLCDGQRTVSQIVAILAGEYEAPLAIIEGDLLELLTDLAHAELVVENP